MSKFDFLKNKNTTPQSEQVRTQKPKSSDIQTVESSNTQTTESPDTQTGESSTTQQTKRDQKQLTKPTGRPKGKRSNPDYTQVTSYIKKSTHKAVQRELLEQDKEFSELVQELLEEWLSNI